MSDKSSIEWTDATWNPTTGCTKISPGCAHCYIERTVPFRTKGRRFEKGHIPLQLHHERLLQPFAWKQPRRIFVNSLSDLFHADIPDDFIDTVFAVMALTREHMYQVLTKRADRLLAYMTTPDRKQTIAGRVMEISNALACKAKSAAARVKLEHFSSCFAGSGPFPNVWLGVSTEDQVRADERLPLLLQTPAAARFLSCEPLLGPVDLRHAVRLGHNDLGWDSAELIECVDWVIIGGESGPRSRPCHVAWVRSLVAQCREVGVACFVEQLGDCAVTSEDEADWSVGNHHSLGLTTSKGGDPAEWPPDLRIREWPADVRVRECPDQAKAVQP